MSFFYIDIIPSYTLLHVFPACGFSFDRLHRYKIKISFYCPKSNHVTDIRVKSVLLTENPLRASEKENYYFPVVTSIFQMKIFSCGTVMFQLMTLPFKSQKQNHDKIKRHYKDKNVHL